MKIKTLHLLILLALLAGLHQAAAQGTTAFTYQGQLRDGGTNANGAYTMTFKLYDAASGGGQIGGIVTTSLTLANGLFTVNLDFGAGAFNGAGRWLDITVQSGTNAAETLTPRVQVLPAPYAIYAAVAATVTNSAIMNAQLAGNAVNTTNIQNGAITTALIANGAVTNENLTANAVATANIQNSAVTDAKIVSVSGSKVSGGVALATNANYAGSANELHTYVTTSGSLTNFTDFWDVYPAITASPGIVPHDLVFSANGAAQMVIRPNGQGAFVHGLHISPVPNGIQVFTASGTFTIPTNVTRIMVEMWGGGGGGGGGVFFHEEDENNNTTNVAIYAGGGGGSGGYALGIFNVIPGTTYSVITGIGGAGGIGHFSSDPGAGTAGTAGTSSSFGGFLVANGGGGGGGASMEVNGVGGIKPSPASGSVFPAGIGNTGFDGINYISGAVTLSVGGKGGDSFRGGNGGLGGPIGGRGFEGGEGALGGGGGGGSGGFNGGGGSSSGVVITY